MKSKIRRVLSTALFVGCLMFSGKMFAAGIVYVINYVGGSVSVIDMATNTVITTIPIENFSVSPGALGERS